MKQNKTILVVDDNEIIRQSICEFIQLLRPTWDIVEAVNGWEGWRLTTTVRFDLIITDLQMPVMDGYEMVLSLQKTPATCAIPVVIVTHEDGNDPHMAQLRTLCRAVIFKPFLCDQLAGILETIGTP